MLVLDVIGRALKPFLFICRWSLVLKALIVDGVKRLSGQGGNPVVELQTNFGGGKTHSMLALYHLVGGTKPHDLPGVDQLLNTSKVSLPDTIAHAVLVGT